MSEVKKKSMRSQLEEKIKQLDGFYEDYYVFSGRAYNPEMDYSITEWTAFVLYVIFSVVISFAICFISIELSYDVFPTRNFVIAFILLSCVIFAAFILIARFEDWSANRACESTRSVTFHFCTKKALARVQKDIDAIKPEVIRLREAYEDKQKAQLRDSCTKTIRAAEELNPQFKALFKTIEEELGATVKTTLSPNNDGLPEDVILEAEIRDLPTFDNELIKNMVAGHEKFKISESELRFWESCVAILTSYKKSKAPTA